MRILMVNYEFPPVGGGGGNANYYLAREMVRLGHEVTVVTSYFRGLALSEDVQGIRVLRVKLWRKRRDYTKFHEMLQYVLFALPKVRSLCRREHFDIVQTFFAIPSGPVGYAAARAARVPLVIRLGGGDLPGHDPDRFVLLHRVLKPVVRFLLRRSMTRVVNSQGLHERAVQAYPGLDFAVIPNGIDLDEFHAPRERDNAVPVILFASRLIERKGLQHILPVLAQLAREDVPFALLVAGDGPLRPALEQQVADLGLTDRVTFLGLVPHEQLPAVYQAADIFVLPSTNEGMPNVVLEAIASGLAVVGTMVPGMPELVEEGHSGFLVPIGEWEGFARPLRLLLTDRQRCREMGEASAVHAAQFSWRRLAEMYLTIYARGGAEGTGK
jgi:glycosyltransferase involved in cell wall biosynthesis